MNEEKKENKMRKIGRRQGTKRNETQSKQNISSADNIPAANINCYLYVLR